MSPVVSVSLAAHAQLLDGDVYASPPACLAYHSRLNVATSTTVGTALPESINMQHQIDKLFAWNKKVPIVDQLNVGELQRKGLFNEMWLLTARRLFAN